MCRLAAITSAEYISPMESVLALETMKEGHDGSGLGIMMKDLGGEFERLKGYPVLSAICSGPGLVILDEYMEKQGFEVKHSWTPDIQRGKGSPKKGPLLRPCLRIPCFLSGQDPP